MLLAPSRLQRGLITGTPGTRSGRTTITPPTDGIPLASPSVTGNGRPLYRLPTALRLQPPAMWSTHPRRFRNRCPLPNGRSIFEVRLKRCRESNNETDRFALILPGSAAGTFQAGIDLVR